MIGQVSPYRQGINSNKIPQQLMKNRRNAPNNGVRCVAFAATIAAMLILSSRIKSKEGLMAVTAISEDKPMPCSNASRLTQGSHWASMAVSAVVLNLRR
ncbi:hypothetical protein D3C80_1852030 [compost metagenome]